MGRLGLSRPDRPCSGAGTARSRRVASGKQRQGDGRRDPEHAHTAQRLAPADDPV